MAGISMLWEGAPSYRQCCVVLPVLGSGLEEGVCPALIQIWALELNFGWGGGVVWLSHHGRDFDLYFHMIRKQTSTTHHFLVRKRRDQYELRSMDKMQLSGASSTLFMAFSSSWINCACVYICNGCFSLTTRLGFPHFIFSFIDPACGNSFNGWIKVHTSPLMRLSRADDLISPTVKLSSLKHHLLSFFSSRPHSFSCFFAISLSPSHFRCSCHVGPASSAVLPRPFPVFFLLFPFFVPSLLFTITPSVLRPHLSFFCLGRIERGQGSTVVPRDTAAVFSFSPDVIWGIHSLATASFPSSPLSSFLLGSPEKSKSVLYYLSSSCYLIICNILFSFHLFFSVYFSSVVQRWLWDRTVWKQV